MTPNTVLGQFLAVLLMLNSASAAPPQPVETLPQKQLQYAPLQGYASTGDGIARITIRGQVAEGIFNQLNPIISHTQDKNSCALGGESKFSDDIQCTRSGKDYACYLIYDLKSGKIRKNNKNDLFCDDSDADEVKRLQNEAKKQGYWRID